MKILSTPLGTSILLGALAGLVPAQLTPEPAMLAGDSPATDNGWTVTPLFTIGETINGYQPVGIPDGIFAFPKSTNVATVLLNHELPSSTGYAYTLGNGTTLTGARISFFRITRSVTGGVPTVSVDNAGLAYTTVYDRHGVIVTDAAQINEAGNPTNGFARLCSSNGVLKGSYGFVDNIYFAGEEDGKPSHPHGGSLWALDVRKREIWAVPALGRFAWENVTPLDSGDPGKVALVVADDTEGSGLYLWVGVKNGAGDNSFLDRNGLKVGSLYAWKADNGDLTPQQFNGVNSSRTGTWVEMTVQDPASAGLPGYDEQGYLDIDLLQSQADQLGGFSFSRPEDVSTNPYDGTQFAFAPTGRGQLFPADNWGDVLVVDVDFGDLTAEIVIKHDADDLAVPDAGIRNPDNLVWARDGKIYVNEDRSTSPSSLFGAATGIEASVWRLDPVTGSYKRIAEIDRSAVPAGMTDPSPTDIGNWETSGVLDVTNLFGTLPGERLLILDVQAHSLQDGPIGGNPVLDEGGQLLFLSKVGN